MIMPDMGGEKTYNRNLNLLPRLMTPSASGRKIRE